MAVVLLDLLIPKALRGRPGQEPVGVLGFYRILLSLLHLGVKNMKIGPSLPAFVKEPVFKVLQEQFNLQAVTTPEQDLKEILG